MNTFRNPIADFDTPDPFITYDKETGYYYSLFTRHNYLELFRCKRVADIIRHGESKIIYRPDGKKDGIWGDLWAPEMHRGSDGNWYIYTSGRITEGKGPKRMIVLRALSPDPFGDWEFAGMPTPDIFSIDPTSYIAKDGKQYLCNSRVDNELGQVLDIYEMKSPTKLDTKRWAQIAVAEKEWELVPPYVGDWACVEGGFFVEKNGRLYIIYSANGCWSDHYCLGVLEHLGGDLCDAANWKKHDEPLLTYGNGAYGPGHASFFYSPDGSELWCAYHALKRHNENTEPDTRYMNIQRVDFDETGYPVMGKTVGYEADIPCPSGEE
jgi:GH43 family beta-xylosidase